MIPTSALQSWCSRRCGTIRQSRKYSEYLNLFIWRSGAPPKAASWRAAPASSQHMTSAEGRTQNRQKFARTAQVHCPTDTLPQRLTSRQHLNSTSQIARSHMPACRIHQPSHRGEQNHALVCSPPTPPSHHSPCNMLCAQEHPMHER